jgi:hypothetical protein
MTGEAIFSGAGFYSGMRLVGTCTGLLKTSSGLISLVENSEDSGWGTDFANPVFPNKEILGSSTGLTTGVGFEEVKRPPLPKRLGWEGVSVLLVLFPIEKRLIYGYSVFYFL